MAQIPFVGPSYNLDSRPASVQRTINLVPYPQEPGNERTKWVFKDVPGLVAYAPTTYDTIALLNFNGTNGSTTISDVYANTTWSVQATGSLSTTAPKFGSACWSSDGLFNGRGVRSSTAFATLGLGDFTIECWFKSSNSTQMAICNFIGNTNLGVFLISGNISVSSFATVDGTLVCSSTGSGFNDNQWHFCQVVRSSLVTTVYVDGSAVATGNDLRDYSTAAVVAVGATVAPSGASPWLGNLDDFRLTLSARPNIVPSSQFLN